MQAPKDGDAFAAAWAELKALQNDHKRLEDPRTSQDRGEPIGSFVTRDSPRKADIKRVSDAFARGFTKGLHPLTMGDVSIEHPANQDATVFRIMDATVSVSGLDMIQATDPEALGCAKGEALRRLVQVFPARSREGQAMQALERAMEPDMPPKTWMLLGAPDDVPAAPAFDFDHWHLSPYTRVLERREADLHARLHAVDLELSRVLHELAGEASLCWVPKPEGTFDSSAAIVACERAIGELRAIIRGV